MAAYYNEIDPFAAQWLRNLITAGLIPKGEVDERSVLDVRPADLRPFRQCHFFAGIAGWAHALDLAGWPDDRPVWTGSVPCQPLSSAGQRRGHADERHLWPAFHELIAECRPAILFGEQVASKLGREWFSGVRADLEHLGFAVGGADLPAACVGAPHIRQRLYWVANAEEMRRSGRPTSVRRETRGDVAGSGGGLGDTDREGRSRRRQPQHAAEQGSLWLLLDRPSAGGFRNGAAGGVGDTTLAGRGQERPDPGGRGEGDRPQGSAERPRLNDGLGGGGLADAVRERQEGRERPELPSVPARRHQPPRRPGGGLADTQRDDRGADLAERRPQGRALDFWADAVWLQCLDGKARRIEPTIQPLATGIRNRVGLLRGSGNSIVPQAAAVFITAVMEAL